MRYIGMWVEYLPLYLCRSRNKRLQYASVSKAPLECWRSVIASSAYVTSYNTSLTKVLLLLLSTVLLYNIFDTLICDKICRVWFQPSLQQFRVWIKKWVNRLFLPNWEYQHYKLFSIAILITNIENCSVIRTHLSIQRFSGFHDELFILRAKLFKSYFQICKKYCLNYLFIYLFIHLVFIIAEGTL